MSVVRGVCSIPGSETGSAPGSGIRHSVVVQDDPTNTCTLRHSLRPLVTSSYFNLDPHYSTKRGKNDALG